MSNQQETLNPGDKIFYLKDDEIVEALYMERYNPLVIWAVTPEHWDEREDYCFALANNRWATSEVGLLGAILDDLKKQQEKLEERIAATRQLIEKYGAERE